jgi:cysteine desulfuration protein SufE
MTIDQLLEEFNSLEDWEERCDFLIDLGFELQGLPPEAKTEENRVHGCQSNVWLVARVKQNGEPVIELEADSDSMLVKGLVSVLLTIYSGRTTAEILEIDVKDIFAQLGFDRYLSSARRNGLFGMVKKIRTIAEHSA